MIKKLSEFSIAFLSTIVMISLMVISASKTCANIAVIDSANLAKSAEQVAAWGKQLEAMRSQLEKTKQHYGAITGSRGLGEILSNPTLRANLPPEYRTIYEQVNSDDYGIADMMQNISRAESAGLEGTVKDIQRNIEARKNRSNIINKAVALKAYDGANERLKQVESLMKEINKTKDLKGIEELQARILVEQATISNEANRLKVISHLQKAEHKLIKEQKNELNRRILSSKNTEMPSIK